MKEIWKDIQGYEGLYQVSNLGRVKSLKNRKILSPDISLGYERVTLFLDGKKSRFLVHRLVAQSFIPNPQNHRFINHKDENRSNNRMTNLEWCDASYNINYGHRNKKLSQKSNHVIQCELDGTFIAEYASVPVAAKILNLKCSTLYQCCNNNVTSAYGYFWKYAHSSRK